MKTENKFRDSQIRPFLDMLEECEYIIKEAKSLRAIPDIIGCWKGIPFYLEVKRSKASMKEKRTALQAYTLEKYRKSGAYTSFIYPENCRIVLATLVTTAWENAKIDFITKDNLMKLIPPTPKKILKPSKNRL